MAFRSHKDVDKIKNPKRGTTTGQTGRPPVASNPLTSEEVKDSPAPSKTGAYAAASTDRKKSRSVKRADHRMTVTQLDEFGLKIAGLPMAIKDKETFAQMFMDHENVKDRLRFMNQVHSTEVATPKT